MAGLCDCGQNHSHIVVLHISSVNTQPVRSGFALTELVYPTFFIN